MYHSSFYKTTLIIILFTSCIIGVGCQNRLKEPEITTIRGRAFLQPIDKKLSLALAPTTYIVINFIDSAYCDIEYKGYRRLTASRKYSIDTNDVFKIFNPVNDKVRTYKIIRGENETFIGDEDNTKLYKIISADSLNHYPRSSSLRRAEFLYPALDDNERVNGAEDRYVNENGMLRNIPHPLRAEVRKINIFNLF